MTRKYILLSLLLTVNFISGQNLNKEITIDKDIVPIETGVNRISLFPQVISQTLSPVSLSYDKTGIPVAVLPYSPLTRIPIVRYAIEPSQWNGYFDGGYFPAYNVGISAGYRLLNSPNDKLNARVQFDGANWENFKIKDEENNVISQGEKFKDNTASVGLSYQHFVSDISVLGIDASYQGSWFNYPYYDDAEAKQSVYDATALISWRSRVNRVDYSIKGSFNGFGFSRAMVPVSTKYDYYKPVKELKGILEGDFFVKIGEERRTAVGLEYMGQLNHYDASQPMSVKDVSGLVRIVPAFTSHGTNYNLKLGVKADFSINDGNTFHVAPEVEADYSTSPFFKIGIIANGGEEMNSVESLFNESHYINPSAVYRFSHIPLTGHAFIVVGPYNGLSLTLAGGYNIANDWLMPYESTGNLENVDMKGWDASAEARWKGNRWGELFASIAVAPSDYDKGIWQWRDRAKMVVKGGFSVFPVKTFNIDANIEFRNGRKFFINPEEYIELEKVLDLSIGARYSFNDNFGIFAKVDNVLNRQWEQWIGPDVASKKLNGLIGVTLKF